MIEMLVAAGQPSITTVLFNVFSNWMIITLFKYDAGISNELIATGRGVG